MAKLSKRMSALKKSINQDRKYNIIDGLELLKKFTSTRFVENVDVAINLGIDARKSNQNIRGYVLMPHGIGRNIYVAVFAQAESAKLAKDSGADLVGLHDLADQIKKKVSNKLDVVVAMPDTMNIVSRLGSILGPRGLMPNPKVGTVSDNISETVKNIKKGQIRYRNDKNGIIHAGFGKINFSSVNLKENLEALILSLKQMKPKNYKGEYIKKITISTTMGVSILINENSLFVSV